MPDKVSEAEWQAFLWGVAVGRKKDKSAAFLDACKLMGWNATAIATRVAPEYAPPGFVAAAARLIP